MPSISDSPHSIAETIVQSLQVWDRIHQAKQSIETELSRPTHLQRKDILRRLIQVFERSITSLESEKLESMAHTLQLLAMDATFTPEKEEEIWNQIQNQEPFPIPPGRLLDIACAAEIDLSHLKSKIVLYKRSLEQKEDPPAVLRSETKCAQLFKMCAPFLLPAASILIPTIAILIGARI